MKTNIYPVKLWFTSTVVIAPVLLLIVGLINGVKNAGVETIPIFILFGIIFSLPVLLICLLIFRVLIQNISSIILIKLIFVSVVILGVWITFLIISGSKAYMMALLYSGSVIVSSLFYRIDKQ